MIFALFLLATPASDQTPSVFLRGQINANTVDQVRVAAEHGARHLIITSSGGYRESGVELGEIIAQYDMDVSVDQYCFSACASFAFVAARNRFIYPGSVIGFHKTSTAYENLAEIHHLQELKANVSDRARRERALYEARGVDRKLLLDPFVATGPTCYQITVTQQGNERVEVRQRAAFWYPTLDYLRSAGITDSLEHWPQSEDDLRQRLQKINLSYALAYSYGEPMPREAGEKILEEIEPCT